jgi:hypothetical protein
LQPPAATSERPMPSRPTNVERCVLENMESTPM